MGNGQGTIAFDNCTVVFRKQIAEGGFGYVSLVEDEKGRKYAMKKVIVPMDDVERNNFARHEQRILSTIPPHPNIVRFYGACTQEVSDKRQRHYCTLLEYCSGNVWEAMLECRSRETKLPESKVCSIFRDTCLAIHHLHSQTPPIAHRDLKVENLLFGVDGHIKLTDFGSCTTDHGIWTSNKEIVNKEEEISKNTTLAYRSPEQVDLYQKRKVSEKVDIWSLGVLLFVMTTERTPFSDMNGNVEKMGILNCRYRFPADWEYSIGIKEFIVYLLNPDPDARPSVHDVLCFGMSLKDSNKLPCWPGIPVNIPVWPSTDHETIPATTSGVTPAGRGDESKKGTPTTTSRKGGGTSTQEMLIAENQRRDSTSSTSESTKAVAISRQDSIGGGAGNRSTSGARKQQKAISRTVTSSSGVTKTHSKSSRPSPPEDRPLESDLSRESEETFDPFKTGTPINSSSNSTSNGSTSTSTSNSLSSGSAAKGNMQYRIRQKQSARIKDAISGTARQMGEGLSYMIQSSLSKTDRETEMLMWVKKATSSQPGFPKAKYLRFIVVALWESELTVDWLLNRLADRPWANSALVSCKVLVTLMKVMQQGPPKILGSYGAYVGYIEQIEQHWTNVTTLFNRIPSSVIGSNSSSYSSPAVNLNSHSTSRYSPSLPSTSNTRDITHNSESNNDINISTIDNNYPNNNADKQRRKPNGYHMALFICRFASLLRQKLRFHSFHPEFGTHFTTLATLTGRETLPSNINISAIPGVLSRLLTVSSAVDATQKSIFKTSLLEDNSGHYLATSEEMVTAYGALLPIIEESYVLFIACLHLLEALQNFVSEQDTTTSNITTTTSVSSSTIHALVEQFEWQFLSLQEFYAKCKSVPFVANMNCTPSLPDICPITSLTSSTAVATATDRPHHNLKSITKPQSSTSSLFWSQQLPSQVTSAADARSHFFALESSEPQPQQHEREEEDDEEESGAGSKAGEEENFDPFCLYSTLPDAPSQFNTTAYGLAELTIEVREAIPSLTKTNTSRTASKESRQTNISPIPFDHFGPVDWPNQQQQQQPNPFNSVNLFDFDTPSVQPTNTTRTASPTCTGVEIESMHPLDRFSSFQGVSEKITSTDESSFVSTTRSKETDLIAFDSFIQSTGPPTPQTQGNGVGHTAHALAVALPPPFLSPSLMPATCPNPFLSQGPATSPSYSQTFDAFQAPTSTSLHRRQYETTQKLKDEFAPIDMNAFDDNKTGSSGHRLVAWPDASGSTTTNMNNIFDAFETQPAGRINYRMDSVTAVNSLVSSAAATSGNAPVLSVTSVPTRSGLNPFGTNISVGPAAQHGGEDGTAPDAVGGVSASLTAQADAIYCPALQPWREEVIQNGSNSALFNALQSCIRQFGVWGLDLPFKNLDVECVIGTGAFAVVYKAKVRNTGKNIAIKKLLSTAGQNLTEKTLKDFLMEADFMRTFRHPNIVELLGTSTDPVSVSMEYCERGNLMVVLQDDTIELSFLSRLNLMIGIADGMSYLHSRNPIVIHRDLKSLNILITDDWNSKITDFGLSRLSAEHNTNAMMTGQIGTFHWMAPEVISGTIYSAKADVYSFAIIAWEILTRETPFMGMHPVQILTAVCNSNLRPTLPPNTPPLLASLIKQSWSSVPNDRPSFRDIFARLKEMKKTLNV